MLKYYFSLLLLCSAPLAAADTKVLAISGSTREDSWNKKLVKNAADLAKQMGATVTYVDLRDFQMPFYDADVEAKGMPENAKRLRKMMIDSQAIIIATPEYNASISAVLKNALDWASRDEQGNPSRDAFKGKKFAIMSTSPGPGGGSRALAHLRAIIENVGGEVVTVQTAVPNAHEAFKTEGALQVPATQDQLKQEVQMLLSK